MQDQVHWVTVKMAAPVFLQTGPQLTGYKLTISERRWNYKSHSLKFKLRWKYTSPNWPLWWSLTEHACRFIVCFKTRLAMGQINVILTDILIVWWSPDKKLGVLMALLKNKLKIVIVFKRKFAERWSCLLEAFCWY